MTDNAALVSEVVTREQWLVARSQLLEREKALTHARAEVAAARRALPMVLLTKHYVFEGAEGTQSLVDLFQDRSQLVVYHFMYGPGWAQPCEGCSAWANAFNGTTYQFAKADARLVAISRGPYEQLAAMAAERDWRFPWLSARDTDFNYDFYASSHDTSPGSSLRIGDAQSGELVEFDRGENHGVSVFSKDADGAVYHTYSSYNRGIEALNGALGYFDLLPKGRAW